MDNPRWHWYSPRKRYLCNSHLPGIKRRVSEFEKGIDVDLYQLDLFRWNYRYLLFADGHDADTVKFEKVKVQNSVRLKYKFYKAILKVFSFWRGFSQSSELDSRYTSEAENSRDTPSHHLIYLVMWLRKILISQILMDSDVQMSRYFSKSHCPIVVMLQAPGEECHLDYSQELYLSNFGDHRPCKSADNVNFIL